MINENIIQTRSDADLLHPSRGKDASLKPQNLTTCVCMSRLEDDSTAVENDYEDGAKIHTSHPNTHKYWHHYSLKYYAVNFFVKKIKFIFGYRNKFEYNAFCCIINTNKFKAVIYMSTL